ncbi:MAG: tRNA (guanine(10)-N(2))-dimethyltransferase [Candidatus Nanohaloarchaea archaeon]|nr:tRNA (guanine(10)-N(2))-dimethyltransferase [Candidatus Nanohaloarchaea archaeon]
MGGHTRERGVELSVEVEEEPTTDSDVFYNRDMVINRDISVACLSAFDGEDLRICDALGGSGVRGLRYLEEVETVSTALINDIKEEAVENIRENVEMNGVEGAEVSRKDANLLLTENFRSLDYVDVDPFGSPAPYLDSAARSLGHESAVGVTATDLGPLYGSYPEVCRRRYAAEPMKTEFGHEVGLRILVKEVIQAFSRYDYAFIPLLAWNEQHYSRVFGRVEDSKQRANRLMEDIGGLSFCRECRWRGYGREERCPVCGGDTESAGPLWKGKLGDAEFAEDVVHELGDRGYGEAEEMVGTLSRELEVETPFYDLHELASTEGVKVPERDSFIGRLGERGFRASRTHFTPQGVRTDAPLQEMREVL